MTPLRRVLFAVFLLAVGFFAVPLARELFPTQADWEEQLQRDAETALQVLKPGAPRELPEDFWTPWDRRLDLYDEEHRAELRRRLHVYLDWLEAEYADASEVYTSGRDPRLASAALTELRGRLPAAFGPLAEKIRGDGERLQEDAFRTSPANGGIDPDAPDFRIELEVLRSWLGVARPRADALTTPAAERDGD